MNKYTFFAIAIFFGCLAHAQTNWVGGATGNWNVGANWSTGNVPQNGEDIVINGAVTVTINSTITQIPDDMTISGGATLEVAAGGSLATDDAGGNQGDVTLNNGTINVTGGTIYFGDDIAASNGSAINVSSGTFQVDDAGTFNDTDVTVSGGNFFLGDGDGDDHDFTNGSTITVTGGTFDVRDIDVVDSTIDVTGGTVNVDDFGITGSSTANLDGGTIGSTGYLYTDDNSVLNLNTTFTNTTGAGNAGDDLYIYGASTVNIGPGANVTGLNDITFEGNNADVATLNVTGGSIEIIDDINLDNTQGDIINISGGTVTVPNDVDILDTDAQITVSGGTLDAGVIDDSNTGGEDVSDNITVSGSGTVSEGGVEVLPVELISFKGILQASSVELIWKTASELNNERFDLQKSTDGVNYLTISTIQGSGTTSQQSEYRYTDKSVGKGILYYRLVQYDFDGEFEVLPTISINNESQVAASSMKLYPNPVFQNHITIELEGKIITNGWTASIYNLKGQIVLQADGATGSPLLRIDNLRSSIEPGVYLLRVQGEAEVLSRRIVLQ
jgi:hypothetical protein